MGGVPAVGGALSIGSLGLAAVVCPTIAGLDLLDAIKRANQAVDELGGLAVKLEDACHTLDAALASEV